MLSTFDYNLFTIKLEVLKEIFLINSKKNLLLQYQECNYVAALQSTINDLELRLEDLKVSLHQIINLEK